MLRTRTRRIVLAVLALVTLGLVGASIAGAVYNVKGQGEATVSSAAVKDLEISEVRLDNELIPGETTGGSLVVHNPNRFPVRLTSIVPDRFEFPAKPQCAGQFSQPSPAGTVTPQTIGAGAYVRVTVDRVVTFSKDATEACAGAKITVFFTVNAVQTDAAPAAPGAAA